MATGCATPTPHATPPVALPVAAPGQPGWSTDPVSGCRLWNPNPRAAETPRWSGACPDGVASGPGTAEWRWPGDGESRLFAITGSFVDGRPQGRVSVQQPNGFRYDGASRDGRPEGWGSAVFADGGRYQGLWRNGRPDGEGRLERAAWTYDGQLHDGRPHGWGTISFANGMRYDGNWRDGNAEGFGELHLPAGGRVLGFWHAGCYGKRGGGVGVGVAVAHCRPVGSGAAGPVSTR
ncbi:hypothetical protein CKO45_11925 [Paracraurococcus ruber]|uniref:MORN repeat-containing protein n=1 Tax=Paracraurococcus ruber TaxID=77675 RepID=A0ABS1CY43_9PROT|nr:hypothetical protein [Paracraurococcus ruber]